jgi:hypothetical protein
MSFLKVTEQCNGLSRQLLTAALTTIVAVGLSVATVGQSGTGTRSGAGAPTATKSAGPSTGSPPVALGGSLSLATIEAAPRNVDHTIVRLRRFFDEHGQVVAVREELRVDADGTANSPYSVTFLGVEGELPGSAATQEWAQNYARYGNLLAEHGSFRVRDLTYAQANYTLHDFGPVVRVGRAAHRVVVFPNQLDKAVWLVDVDDATFLPLYSAEYDPAFRLLSEIEALSFASSVQVVTPSVATMAMSNYLDFASAKLAMGSPKGLVEPNKHLGGEYVVSSVQVADNPLNGRQTLLFTYTDGVDEFFVIESPGVSEFFAGLPSQVPSGVKTANTIARYRDASMSVLMFWDDNVGFQVTGRGSLRRLDGFAKSIFTQALLTH